MSRHADQITQAELALWEDARHPFTSHTEWVALLRLHCDQVAEAQNLVFCARIAEQDRSNDALLERVKAERDRLLKAAQTAVDEIRAGYQHHQAAGVVFTDKGTVSCSFRTAELALVEALPPVASTQSRCPDCGRLAKP